MLSNICPGENRRMMQLIADHVEFLLRNVTMGSIASVFPVTTVRAGESASDRCQMIANEFCS